MRQFEKTKQFEIAPINNGIIKKEDQDYLVYTELPYAIATVTYYRSGWGNEYRKTVEEFGRFLEIEETTGRSSATYHPYILVTDTNDNHYLYVIEYSGNWKVVFEKTNRATFLKVNIGDGVEINCELYVPQVLMIQGEDEQVIYEQLKAYIDHVNPPHKNLENFPLSYNHWWAYEDQKINEQVFLENAKIAAQIGLDYCVLDAGWFGSGDEWMNIRGDWEKENTKAFPNGIKYLSNEVEKLGLKFGIWIEVEALGLKAESRKILNQYVMENENETNDLICFGNRKVVDWAVEKISQLIEKTNAKWLKMDFNIDPKGGCKSANHDHKKTDGLQAHYTGLYEVVKTIRKKYPDVIFENCSSGGLRTDSKILQLFDVNFLSDADYIEHKIRCFKNSNNFIPQRKNYHFMPSMTLTDFDSGFRSTDFRNMTESEINYNLVSGLMGLTGLSHRLVEYDQKIIEQITKFVTIYKTQCLKFLKNGEYQIDDNHVRTIIEYTLGDEKLQVVMAHKKFDYDNRGIDLLSNQQFPNVIEEKTGKIILIK